MFQSFLELFLQKICGIVRINFEHVFLRLRAEHAWQHFLMRFSELPYVRVNVVGSAIFFASSTVISLWSAIVGDTATFVLEFV